MSNETKWDVFEELLDAYDDAKSSDGNLHPTQELLDYDDRYAAAFPDDLPVIPKNVGNFIKESVYAPATLQEALECAHDEQFRVGRWVSAHSEIFARAWVLGVWCVEETGEIVKLEAEK